jgi:hypothetical protein
VRVNRNVLTDFPLPVNSFDDYKRELLRDAKKDFIGEGQLFYMYKRLGININADMEKENFVFSIPDSEFIN